jgi:cell division protein FtsA
MQDSEDRIMDQLPNRRILHSIPLQYYIDNQKVLGRPHNLEGSKFELDSLFITAYEQHVTDLIEAVEAAGVYVEDVMASPLAASFVLLSKAQKRAGCVLVNIGAETTSLVVFEDSVPISLQVFPTGSNDITNDIALKLRVSLEEAEKIKRGGITSARFSKKQFDDIVAERLETIFSIIESHLTKLKRSGALPAGVILTGGGAGASVSVATAKRVLAIPATVAAIESGRARVRDTVWAVAYGLCMWGAADQSVTTTIGTVKKVRGSMLSWLKQFLP